MFESAHERVKSLKSGMQELEIERMYIQSNNFKIVIHCKANLPICGGEHAPCMG